MIIEINIEDFGLGVTSAEAKMAAELSSIQPKIHEYPVYGIFILYSEILYLICIKRDTSVMQLVSANLCKIKDNRASAHWVFIQRCSNKNIVYFDRKFDDFNYIGIDKFVSDPDFYERYHMDDEKSLAYLKTMQALLETEAAVR